MNTMPTMMSQPVYWRKNQVTLTFFSDLEVDASTADIVNTVTTNLHDFNQHAFSGPFTLERRPLHAGSGQANDMDGIYVYSAPARVIGTVNLPAADITVFCTITTTPDTMTSSDSNSGMGSDAEDVTLQAVKQLNAYARTGKAQVNFQAMPTWLFSCVDDETHGCPVTPPFPVKESSGAGWWKTSLPQLPAALQGATGAGVTAFILDAFPEPERIINAAIEAGGQNTLLQQMAINMVSEDPFTAEPPAISLNYTYEIPGPAETAVTGKDIYGRLSGFPMADHGLFIAGLVRDLAPGARVECIRILNDFGVGDAAALVQALTTIEARQRAGGDLHGKPVVVNLSLVIGPPECDLARLGLALSTDPQEDTQSLPVLLLGLLNLLQSMGRQGATFVASVGNDSDPRDFAMNPFEMRFNARYPAAFANTNPDFIALKEIIPVGAVNQNGNAATYSNYPGPYGIATYGGELPRPNPWVPSAASHVIASVDTTSPVDALCGIYTGLAYPALSRNDQYPVSMQPEPSPSESSPAQPPYPLYKITSGCAWAYWSGTSFAAPIITALAARVLQGLSAPFHGEQVRSAITAISQQTSWTALENGEDTPGPMIKAVQTWQNEEAFSS